MIGVAVCGACGRMGKAVIKKIFEQRDMRLVAAIDAPGTPLAGSDAGELAGIGKLSVPISGAERLKEVLKRTKPAVLVDFTRAEATVQNVETAASLRIPVVVGTTGFSAKQIEKLRNSVKRAEIAAVVAPNMSVGVNVFYKLVAEAARSLGKDYDVEIVETHHSGKVDSPSGTALQTAKLIAQALGLSERKIKCGRPAGRTPRRKGEIYVHPIRAGDVIGEHAVVFAAPGERVELLHRAHSRETFAEGVMKAIRFVAKGGRPGVIHDMQEVLGLK